MPDKSISSFSESDRTTALPPPINGQVLLEHCMGNFALVAMLFDKFDKQARGDIEALRDAIQTSDAKRTASVSHALKGAAGALAAEGVQRTASKLEQSALENRLESAAQLFKDLACEIDRCLAYLPEARTALRGTPDCPSGDGSHV